MNESDLLDGLFGYDATLGEFSDETEDGFDMDEAEFLESVREAST